jgi:hypothetical protein
MEIAFSCTSSGAEPAAQQALDHARRLRGRPRGVERGNQADPHRGRGVEAGAEVARQADRVEPLGGHPGHLEQRLDARAHRALGELQLAHVSLRD